MDSLHHNALHTQPHVDSQITTRRRQTNKHVEVYLTRKGLLKQRSCRPIMDSLHHNHMCIRKSLQDGGKHVEVRKGLLAHVQEAQQDGGGQTIKYLEPRKGFLQNQLQAMALQTTMQHTCKRREEVRQGLLAAVGSCEYGNFNIKTRGCTNKHCSYDSTQ